MVKKLKTNYPFLFNDLGKTILDKKRLKKFKQEHTEENLFLFLKENIINFLFVRFYNRYKFTIPFKSTSFFSNGNKLLKESKNFKELEDNYKDFLNKFEEKKEFYKYRFEQQEIELKEKIKPTQIENYYVKARKINRVIEAFLGPTNSGKTHKAIQRLKESKTGIYLAPLRLLAREIYDDLISNGIKTSLITGEETIIDPEATHICSTIEMLDCDKSYDLAVIDEIQFLSDISRGNAWTKALLSLLSRNILVVGSSNSEKILKKISELCGDDLIIHEFERLSSLEVMGKGISFAEVKEGDAIIVFSRKEVHEIAKYLETYKNKKVSVIYGSLPPSVRIEESKRFNNRETEILVATDAIGYGLNLNIKRVLFASLTKFNGFSLQELDQSSFNQISGRAGRYGKFEKGEVGFINNHNLNTKNIFSQLSEDLHKPLENLEQVFYFPDFSIIKELSINSNSESISVLLSKYNSLFVNDFFKFNYNFLTTLNFLDQINLPLEDKYKLMFTPIKENNMSFFAKCVKYIVKNEEFCMNLDLNLNSLDLDDLELISQDILIYMWLSQRYEKNFPCYFYAQEKYNEISDKITILLKKY